jgi:hypothetical protein
MSAIWDNYTLMSQNRWKVRHIWTNDTALLRMSVAEGGINYHMKIDEIGMSQSKSVMKICNARGFIRGDASVAWDDLKCQHFKLSIFN